MSEIKNLVEVKHLKEYFPINTGMFKTKPLKAVDDVSFAIRKGETLGLVGESGCGKTTVGRTLLHLYKPTSGEIWFDGKQIVTKQDILEYRKKSAMVFQDPYSSLNPTMTVADIIADEPVSALDVSIQAQVINMFDELQEEMGLTYLFIAHDLLVVRHISDRIAVMYLGKMVEMADAAEIYDHPLHPYTKCLMSAVPLPDPIKARENKRIVLHGDIPSPLHAPSGCPFRTRCPYATDACAEAMPEFKEVAAGHFVACHHVDKIN